METVLIGEREVREMKKVKEYYKHWLPPLLGASAVTLGHTIFYEKEEFKIKPTLRRHELVHVEQCERFTTVGFFIIYFFHYIKFRLEGLNHWEAYYKNPLEIEAYARQNEVLK